MPTSPDHIAHAARHLSQAKPSRGLAEHRVRRPALILALDRSNPDTTRVLVEHKAPEFFALHQWPGQYTTVALDRGQPRYVAIANAPGEHEDRWEFLLSNDSTLGRTISPHTTLTLTAPEGAGFHRALWTPGASRRLLFCTGSGIGAIRSLVNHMRARHPEVLAQTHLYYGVGGVKDVAYTRTLMAWEALGVEVHVAYDQGIEGYARYVTGAFDAHPAPLKGAQVGLSGSPVMTREVVKMLLGRGLGLDQVHLNVDVAKFDPMTHTSTP